MVSNSPVLIYCWSYHYAGQKVGIMLEELGIDYDAHSKLMLFLFSYSNWFDLAINIGKGDQFTSGFVEVNPNSKIPAAVDRDGPGGQPINLFESASIVLYLAEKYQRFIPTDPRLKAEMFNWVFWQMGGQGPNTGAYGHFMVYAPGDKKETRDYGVARYGMEVQRLCSVLDRHLAGRTYIVGEEYSIADMIIYPWFRQLTIGYKHTSGIGANEFLSVDQYKNIHAWAERVGARPAVQRGITVNAFGKAPKPWLEEEQK